MAFHHTHLPTFVRAWIGFKSWYKDTLWWERFVVQFLLTGVVVYALYFAFVAPPAGFPLGAYVTVSPGQSLADIAQEFKSRGLVTSSILTDATVRLFGSDRKVPAGAYYFPRPESLITIAARLVGGDFETTPVRLTVIEGSTVENIASLLTQKMPGFNKNAFLNAARDKEGYLFPDTYFFMPGVSVEAILSVFSNGFSVHESKIDQQVKAFGKPLQDDVIMASMLEKEAADTQDRRIIAGILWHRLALGMPLQVDAVFPYFLHKSALDLTSDDLKADSPYNTYTNKGLPPGPIDNPGLDALTAAVTPVKSSYLYYLSDKDGNFHYAQTYAQFLANKHKYLGS